MRLKGIDARKLRRRIVKRFVEDTRGLSNNEIDLFDDACRHMYHPHLKYG